MTEQLPMPPIAAEVDLTDFSFMPLDVRRLRDSKLASSSAGEEFRCAVLLWCAAWHQVPAGSLPDDEIELANLAGFGRAVKNWRKVRKGALYSWKKCADGRLYHPVVVEKAIEAWQSKLAEQHRREVDRLRKENKRRTENKEVLLKVPSFEQWNSVRASKGIPPESSDIPPDVHRNSGRHPADSSLKGQGQGQGQGRDMRDARAPGADETASASGGGEGSAESETPEPVDSLPFEQAIQAAFPVGPNPPNWMRALLNARELVGNGLATWAELAAAAERYARYQLASGASVNIAAHNFFDRRKGNYWQQPWDLPASSARAPAKKRWHPDDGDPTEPKAATP